MNYIRKEEMSPRERFLKAINHEEPDRVPVSPRNQDREFINVDVGRGTSDKEYLEYSRVLGFDPFFIFPLHLPLPEEIKMQTRQLDRPDYISKITEYETPKGVLTNKIREYKDETVRKMSAHNSSQQNIEEFLIKNEEDLEKLPFLFNFPDKAERNLSYFKDLVEMVGEDGLVLSSVPNPSFSAATHYGVVNLLIQSRNNRKFVMELLKTYQIEAMKYTEIFLKAGAKVIYTDGCWTTGSLWSPQDFEELFAPLLREQIELTHQYEAKFMYFMDGKCMPHLSILKEIGLDILCPFDSPPTGDADLRMAKKQIGDRICIWGGINSPVDLAKGPVERIRNLVKEAI